jgi:hypothetical protein
MTIPTLLGNPAVVGFIGVIVGALLTGFSKFFLAGFATLRLKPQFNTEVCSSFMCTVIR